MSTLRRVCAVLLLAIFVLPRSARAQDVTGSWTIDYPIMVSIENGVERVDSTATVILTLTQDGETVAGDWRMEGASRTRTLRGAARGGLLTLSDTVDATVTRNDGIPLDVRMASVLELRLDGDRLVGTQSATAVDGSVRSSPRAIEATRAGTR